MVMVLRPMLDGQIDRRNQSHTLSRQQNVTMQANERESPVALGERQLG